MAEAANAAVSRFGTVLGNQIFVYNQVNTKQVLYSLTRVLNNNKALSQIPFVGKKSVPASLRKDLWTPLCVLSFPKAPQGLTAYRQLLEFKHLHSVSWPRSLVLDPENTDAHNNPKALEKKEKIRKLQEEKANAIADMAAVLEIHKRPPDPEKVARARHMVHAEGVKRRPKGAPLGKYSPGKKEFAEVLDWQGSVEGVTLWWADILDAEYAREWPAEVVHGKLAVNRYAPVWPPPEEILLGRRSLTGEGARGNV